MPIHDWTRVPSGLFHHFHREWTGDIARTLNRGGLPKGLCALLEQRSGPWEGDIPTVKAWRELARAGKGGKRGILTSERPAAAIVTRSAKEIYAGRANRIVVNHHLGRVIAVIEIVSPGNKDSRTALRNFVEKALDYLRKGIHLLVVDLFPPTPRDPFGIHKAVWDEISEEEFTFPNGKDRVLASYENGAERAAYVEPVGVGEAMRDMPLFLAEGVHVSVALEASYQSAWDACPEEMQIAVQTGVMPRSDADE